MHGDSELVIRQMNGDYAVRADHLRDYHTHLSNVAESFAEVRFVWIPREENSEADALSKQALEEAWGEARRHRPKVGSGSDADAESGGRLPGR